MGRGGGNVLGLADAGHQCFSHNGAFIFGHSQKKQHFPGFTGMLALGSYWQCQAWIGPGAASSGVRGTEAAPGSTKPTASPSPLPSSLGRLLRRFSRVASLDWDPRMIPGSILPTYCCWRHCRDHTSSHAHSL